WSHAPFANETESFVIKAFGQKFGYTKSSIDGTFCAGGAELNETALICCLNQFIPSYGESGIRGIERNPLIYASSESHHSIVKAAKRSGLGSQSVRVVSVNDNLQMDTEQLRGQIRKDRKDGFLPMMIIGTAGTTGAGAIDNLDALSRIASEENMWFHVDAAYGGAAILSKKISGSLVGIEKSDSITLDLHKWFSVPMGTSIFLTSHKKILHKSFGVKTRYMPKDGDPDKVTDPYLHSGQWSRRFIGLKIYLPLAIHGWQGYSEIIDKQISVGEGLKELLLENNWEIVNNTPLPIICFRKKEDRSGNEIVDLVQQVNDSGKAWLSVYPVKGKKTARICITNYDTGEKDIKDLIHLLNHYSQVSTI
ncbi:MAG: pyridoxal-dependent decarboxylase, partial [Saprospiraceae bacterium]|nr:pyridoxal-dependent decarboxylase [Saprospiraceae bacterium]